MSNDWAQWSMFVLKSIERIESAIKGIDDTIINIVDKLNDRIEQKVTELESKVNEKLEKHDNKYVDQLKELDIKYSKQLDKIKDKQTDNRIDLAGQKVKVGLVLSILSLLGSTIVTLIFQLLL